LLRLPPVLFLLRLLPLVFLLLPPVLFRPLAAALRRLVAAPLRAAAERDAFEREREAAPPFRPPLREELLVLFFPRPDPLFLPPPSSLFTVAHARRAASFRETPRFSYPSSIRSAFRFCFPVYDDLSPRGMVVISRVWMSRVPSRGSPPGRLPGRHRRRKYRPHRVNCCGLGHRRRLEPGAGSSHCEQRSAKQSGCGP
jgi:hypothetical protein